MSFSRMRRTRTIKAWVGIIAHAVFTAFVIGLSTSTAITVYSLADLEWLFGKEPDTSGTPTYVIQVKRYGDEHERPVD